ncbi:MAG: alanine--tRNA ligase [Phycisphaerales bacterium]
MTTSLTRSAAQIRKEFLDYFARQHGHTAVPSAPVVPLHDPTLLFTNAGMNQFKDVFLGTGNREYSRAVDTQKCIRAGGKHNDLEDVGRDTYHHTFFEMLGNWSFGDYFKEEAIAWAWELLTDVWGLDPERLHVTVFAGDVADGTQPDLEAETIWQRYVPRERVQRFGKKDNFWEMGETGPCGPCSEIHYDATPDKSGAKLVNCDDPRVIEIWNLVFIQFNRGQNGKLATLPAKHVDTGMGFERIVRVLQRKESNYDTDVFQPIFAAIANATGARKYAGSMDDAADIAYRIIADHIRCLSIAIADGATPSNEGRGYVLRRILRRASRHAHQTLDCKQPALYKVTPAVVASLGDVFPELKKQEQHIENTIRAEEESFLRTIERGMELFDSAARPREGQPIISAEDAFKLHDTYGFPIDLTRIMAEERGLRVDETGFETLMNDARERSRQKDDDEISLQLPPDAMARLKKLGTGPTIDEAKFSSKPVSTEVCAIWNGTDFDNAAHIGKRVGVILARTSFYAEQGGQVGDRGFIRSTGSPGQVGGWGHETKTGSAAARFRVDDAIRCGDYIVHVGAVVDGTLRVGDRVMADVDDEARIPTMANHTGTHLLNHALRQVLGDGIEQKGSLVAGDRLRFDFSFNRGLTSEEVNAVERLVNAGIHQNMPVHAEDVPLNQALAINGVRAVFGEKYPDPVRVVSIGPSVDRLLVNPEWPRWRECSIEFCGGTHLAKTGAARRLVIVSEQALAAGVRRIVAVTGPAALAADAAGKELEARCFRARSLRDDALVNEVNDISHLSAELTIGEVARQRIDAALETLRSSARAAMKASEAGARDVVVDQARVIAENIQGQILIEEIMGGSAESLRAAIDVLRARRPEAAVMLFSGNHEEGKVTIVARVPEELIKKGLKAGDWVREAARHVDGSGGGKPDLAQAGGKNPDAIDTAIEHAKAFAEGVLG